jgi:hypothetical protein
MPEPMPVFLWFGATEEERAEKMPIIQERIREFEEENGRHATSTEILGIFGEVIEPDDSKRTFLSSRAPTKMPPLHE